MATASAVFSRFSDLPAEIRMMIWQTSLDYDNRPGICVFTRLDGKDDDDFEEPGEEELDEGESIPSGPPLLRVNLETPPTAFYVCRESRALAFKNLRGIRDEDDDEEIAALVNGSTVKEETGTADGSNHVSGPISPWYRPYQPALDILFVNDFFHDSFFDEEFLVQWDLAPAVTHLAVEANALVDRFGSLNSLMPSDSGLEDLASIKRLSLAILDDAHVGCDLGHDTVLRLVEGKRGIAKGDETEVVDDNDNDDDDDEDDGDAQEMIEEMVYEIKVGLSGEFSNTAVGFPAHLFHPETGVLSLHIDAPRVEPVKRVPRTTIQQDMLKT